MKSRRSRRSRRFSVAKLIPSARTRKRWWKRYRKLAPWTQVAVGAVVVAAVWLTVNFAYQVFRKPTELFFPVSGVLNRTPAETWGAYAPIFRRHSTRVVTADFLAALAQTEASGNPVARTYWRWSLTNKPFEVYKPASSAVGMYQITDGTFDQARRLCVHDHEVVQDGPWHAWRTCWFNWAYFRVVPSHAVEMTSAYLHREVTRIVAESKTNPTLSQQQGLAAVIHLCGAGAGASYARRGYRFAPGQRCGDHHAAAYVGRVAAMQRNFLRLDARERGG